MATKLTLFLSIICLQLIGAVFSTVPVFMWSNTNFFKNSNIQEINVISASDIVKGLQQKESTISKYINSNSEVELIVVFAEPKVLSEDMGLLAHSYQSKPNGGAFSNLKRVVELSRSSLVIPYSTQVVESALRQSSSSFGKIYTVGDADLSLTQLMEKINNNNWEALNNGRTDIVIVPFDAQTIHQSHKNNKQIEDSLHQSYADDDATLGKIVDALTSSNTKYLAIFTSNTNDNSNENIIGGHHTQERLSMKQFSDNFRQNGDILYTTNWPDGIIEALIVMAPFLGILLVGVCCTFQLQSDLKFDAEKTILKKQ